ncbi:MAG TPA: DNA primase [Clostridiales bacterium]|nr:DNA primase [Clostridiales bacterium]HCT85382.1 DNA primase [Candidatus Margulisiibacteriota bacterium]
MAATVIDQFSKGQVIENNSVPTQEVILNNLVNEISLIDFNIELSLIGLNLAKEKAAQKHYRIVIIEKLIKYARDKEWNLAVQNDFTYVFNGAYWIPIGKDVFKKFLGNIAIKLGYRLADAKDYKFQDDLYKQFLSEGHFEKPEKKNDEVLINCLNGTLIINKDGYSLKSFESNDFITYQLPFEYNENSRCKRFTQFLNEVLPDQGCQKVIQEYIGYVFIKASILKLEKVLVLHGDGRNGKSVFFDIINALLGEQNITNYSSAQLNEEHYRALISNALLNYSSEFGGGMDSDTFKQLASGEPIGARLKYGNAFTMKDYARLAFNTNILPHNVEHNTAFFRRFLIVPFTQTIPDEKVDPELAKKIITNELAGIFNWVLEGLKRILENKKFTDSEIVSGVLKTYQQESDSVHLFVEERGYKSSTCNYEKLKILYSDYKEFCLDDGLRALGKNNFGKRIESLGFQRGIEGANEKVVYLEKMFL